MSATSRAVPSDSDLRRRLPHIQTSLPSSQNGQATDEPGTASGEPKSSPKQAHQRFVLTDPVAFKSDLQNSYAVTGLILGADTLRKTPPPKFSTADAS
jgi:hypothetical protein